MQLANCKQTYLGLLRLSVGMYAYVRLCIWALSWGICFYSLYILNSLLLPLVWPHSQMLYPNSHANTFSVNEYEWHKVYKYINKNICFEFIWKKHSTLSLIHRYVCWNNCTFVNRQIRVYANKQSSQRNNERRQMFSSHVFTHTPGNSHGQKVQSIHWECFWYLNLCDSLVYLKVAIMSGGL